MRSALRIFVRTVVAARRRAGLVDHTAGSTTPRKISRNASVIRSRMAVPGVLPGRYSEPNGAGCRVVAGPHRVVIDIGG